MAINFNEIPNEIVLPREPPKPTKPTRTVLEEIEARQDLLQERAIKCRDIGPLYELPKKQPRRYTYKYFCVCPHYNPQHVCNHIGNVVIDRDVLTPQEHIVHLATPKENKGAPREPPRFYQKKLIIPTCTSRVNRLAAPKMRRVVHTLTNFKKILSSRQLMALKQQLASTSKVECTSIPQALEWMEEEKRLKKVARRMEKSRCRKLKRKIQAKQRSQIKKIICVLFEEMKDFLLNDQFIMDENSTLVAVILESLQEFTDKEFYTTSNLREYQKILASNLAVWINKFISNLNIHIAEAPPQQQQPEVGPPTEMPTQDFLSFLPVEDYVGSSDADGSLDYKFHCTNANKKKYARCEEKIDDLSNDEGTLMPTTSGTIVEKKTDETE